MQFFTPLPSTITPLEAVLLLGLPAWVVVSQFLAWTLDKTQLFPAEKQGRIRRLLSVLNVISAVAAVVSLVLFLGWSSVGLFVVLGIVVFAMIAAFGGVNATRNARAPKPGVDPTEP